MSLSTQTSQRQALLSLILVCACLSGSEAVASAELATSEAYRYGRFEASIQFARHDGIISSFFLWKQGSEKSNVSWSELDYEKVGLALASRACKLQLNAITGMPGPVDNISFGNASADICASFHTYTFEWTPTYLAWLVDGIEVRRETGALLQDFEDNAREGMEMHFNVWPGDSRFGGQFSADDLPVYQYVDWVRYFSFDGSGFTEQWVDTFHGDVLHERWTFGTWPSPLGHSTHRESNIVLYKDCAVLALTADGYAPSKDSIPPPAARPNDVAIASAEIASALSYRYGRFEASIQFAEHDGIISSFFMWKEGSEKSDTTWNELDYEKVGLSWANPGCKLQLNAITGTPGPVDNISFVDVQGDICARFHTYTFEWTPTYLAWLVDGIEVRRETGALLQDFENSAREGMQMHFNVWPGDSRFGGQFSVNDLPVYQYVDWVRYSAFDGSGFTEQWVDHFDGDWLSPRWSAAAWPSPLGHSTHRSANVMVFGGHAVLALTRESFLPGKGNIPPPEAKAISSFLGSQGRHLEAVSGATSSLASSCVLAVALMGLFRFG